MIDQAIEKIIADASSLQRKTLLLVLDEKYDPSQPRDDHGRFGTGGASAEESIRSKGLADDVNLNGMSGKESHAVLSALESSLSVGGHELKLRSITVVDGMPVGGENGGLGYLAGHVYVSRGFIDHARKNDRDEVAKHLEGTGGKRNYGWQDGNDSADAIGIAVAHEVGHHVDAAMFLDTRKAVRQTMAKGLPFTEQTAVDVSGYASTHPSEMFAEVHAFVSTGRQHMLSESVKDYYKNAIATADPNPMYVRGRSGV